MERLIVLVNGIAGSICGLFVGLMITVFCIVLNIEPQTRITVLLVLFGPEILGLIIGFWLAVRNDWWRMKKEW